MNTNTCRIHNQRTPDKSRMFKYAVRHWAHFRCWLMEKAAELRHPLTDASFVNMLATLHAHDIRVVPVLAVQEVLWSYGITTSPIVVIKAAIKIAEKRES